MRGQLTFSLLWSKYWFNLQTVSEKKISFGLKKGRRGIHFCSEVPKNRESPETPPLPYTSVHFVLPTSGLHVPCAVPNFTGIPVVIAQPAYSVYLWFDKLRKEIGYYTL